MKMVDLFCGRGGWTKGFMAHGWKCIGIDLYPQPDYPGTFIQADIAQMIELPPADFYCCSSPCEQFSVHGMKHFHKNPKWPWLGIALFEHSRRMIEATDKPFVMENVRSAKKFVGASDYHFGPFHLWGNSFQSMWPWPAELRRLKKGMTIGGGEVARRILKEHGRAAVKAYRKQFDVLWTSSKSKARQEYTAKYAEIPTVLSAHVAKAATFQGDGGQATRYAVDWRIEAVKEKEIMTQSQAEEVR